MTRKLISAAMAVIMICICFAGCGCDQSVPTTIDSKEVASKSVDELLDGFATALKNQDKAAYDKLTTDKMKASNNDINKYFNDITDFILEEVAFDSGTQNGTTYEMLVHYYITFSKDYTGSWYKTGINNMTDRFVIVKVGDEYKVDDVIKF